MLEMFKISV